MDARLEQLGGQRCAPRADINREDWKAVDAWIEAAVRSLSELPLKTLAQSAGVLFVLLGDRFELEAPRSFTTVI